MPRIRSLKPDFWMDEKLSEVSRDARLLFMGLWQHCDVAGRCSVTAKVLKATVFPYDEDLTIASVAGMLATLEEKEFVVRYEVDGKPYLWVKNFRKHQRFSGSEATTPSLIPPAPGDKPGSARETNGKPDDAPAETTGSEREADTKQAGSTEEAPGNPGKERKGREGTPLPPRGGPWDYLGEEFDTSELRTAWTGFEEHRKALGKPNGGRYSARGLEAFCGTVKASGANVTQLVGFIAHCMASGWNGLPPTALPKYLADLPKTTTAKPTMDTDLEAREALASR